MGKKKVNQKVVWVIKNVSSLQSEEIFTDPFVIGGCKWKLLASCLQQYDVEYLSLYLGLAADCESLTFEWRRKVYFRITVVNQLSKKLSVWEETKHWFDGIPPRYNWGFASMIPLTELLAENNGFVVNGELMIVAEIKVLSVIGGLDVSVESEKASKMLLTKTKESLDVNAFQILPSQEEPLITFTSMEKQVGKEFVWVLQNFSFNSDKCYSDPFVIERPRMLSWFFSGRHLLAECDLVFLYLSLCIADCQSLPSEALKVRLKIVNQLSENLSILKESELCFDEQSPSCGYAISSEVLAEDGGFLVNGELMIVAEVLGTSDVFDDFIPLRKLEVNGFHVHPSQVQSVKRIFERHPDIAVQFRAKNQHLRTTFMNFLTSLIETLYQPLEELSNEDLVEADIALTYLKDVGFKVDWLEGKLNKVKEKKEKERSCEARVKELEVQLHDLNLKFEMEKAELSATRTPLSFDDVV
ncbi:PREDICTED: MATH domain and coiled-coil domain-containing protein At3g58340-like [Camelina sativa]|uniref:MATH domain and coiled-coil domain-containing protein At3g58340-like n=1 Tax=Camelina sativa TaxID=90675 RepID=A0ABM1RL50_CAMSA|nr:PREDICTED: MATH domain and coiled-coil domain-containing protein At3g58340-like [Camelina sativa]